MAALYPFSALRPEPSRAADVAAVPYDVVDTEEARALAATKPLSFLHVSRAEIDLPPGTDPYSPVVYETAARNFERLRAEAPLIVEAHPSLYFYRLVMGSHTQVGLAACFSVDEYEQDIIRKHERTRKDKEDDRTRHMTAVRAQTGPVFLTYPASGDVDAVAERTLAGEPLIEFTAEDGVRHSIWRVPTVENAGLVGAFRAIPLLYIADGHHRAASAWRARQELRDAGGPHDADAFLAVAFPHDQTQILPYHRVVRDLNGRTPAEFLAALRERCALRRAGAPVEKGEVAMYLDGAWHALQLAPAAANASSVERLDVSLLQAQVIDPLLGIADIRTDKRIDFVGGIRGTGELTRLVDAGTFAVAFALHPVSVRDLMEIADGGGIMPPKSTWFEPKLRDGLLSHVI